VILSSSISVLLALVIQENLPHKCLKAEIFILLKEEIITLR